MGKSLIQRIAAVNVLLMSLMNGLTEVVINVEREWLIQPIVALKDNVIMEQCAYWSQQ
jgi:hypothetical protein